MEAILQTSLRPEGRLSSTVRVTTWYLRNGYLMMDRLGHQITDYLHHSYIDFLSYFAMYVIFSWYTMHKFDISIAPPVPIVWILYKYRTKIMFTSLQPSTVACVPIQPLLESPWFSITRGGICKVRNVPPAMLLSVCIWLHTNSIYVQDSSIIHQYRAGTGSPHSRRGKGV